MDGDAACSHILVCDDDHALRLILEEFLTDEGYRVTVQASLCDDVEDVIALAPNLIVLDLIFSGRSTGLDFLRRLKTTPATQTIPVLTCTAASVGEEAQRQLTTWQCGSITKPFDLDVLIAAVRECLGTKSASA
jgi:CheY-like chemotaxis protein